MRWSDYFTAATYSGASYGDGNLADGYGASTTGICPLDIALHEVRRRLAANAILGGIFQGAVAADKIEVLDGSPIIEMRDLPRLVIYAGSYDDQQMGGGWDLGTAIITVEVLFEPQQARPVPAGEATVASVLWEIAKTLKLYPTIQSVVAGTQVDLARLSRPATWSRARELDLDTGREIEHVVMTWQYELKVDENSARIATIVSAGG